MLVRKDLRGFLSSTFEIPLKSLSNTLRREHWGVSISNQAELSDRTGLQMEDQPHPQEGGSPPAFQVITLLDLTDASLEMRPRG